MEDNMGRSDNKGGKGVTKSGASKKIKASMGNKKGGGKKKK
jgi:hypothetical protein